MCYYCFFLHGLTVTPVAGRVNVNDTPITFWRVTFFANGVGMWL